MLFELSCVCGSENILNKFFLTSRQGRQYLCRSENAIAYVLSSDKKELALQLAEQAKTLGRETPGPVALYSLNMQTLFYSRKIIDVFSPKIVPPVHSQPASRTASPSFTPHHRQTQTTTRTDSTGIGSQKAKELISKPEYATFFITADPKQLKQFFQAILQYSESNKKQKLSHPKPSNMNGGSEGNL